MGGIVVSSVILVSSLGLELDRETKVSRLVARLSGVVIRSASESTEEERAGVVGLSE